MLRPRWLKVLRDLVGNRTRTLLVIASMAVGIFAVAAIAGSQQLLASELNQAYMATNPAHAILSTSRFDTAFLDQIRRVDGVAAVEAKRVVLVRAQVGPDQWKNMELRVIPRFDSVQIHQLRPVSGAVAPRRGEVLIERAALAVLGAKEGEPLLVETPDRKQRELLVVGVTHDLEPFPATLAGMGYGYITEESLEWLGYTPGYNRLQIRLAAERPTVDEISEVAKRVRSRIEKADLILSYTNIPPVGQHPADDIIQALMLLLGVLGLISLVASSFLVINTIGAILTQQRRQIGIMKAIGAQTGQIVGLYLALVASYGLLALLVGLPLGALGAWGFTRLLAGFLNFDLQSRWIPVNVMLLSAVVGLVVPLVASLFPIIATGRLTVREAISEQGAGPGTGRRGLFARLLDRLAFLSRPMLLSLRNTFRRKGRLAITMITLTLGGAIFIGVFSVRASLLLTLDDALQYWNYDVDVDMSRLYRVQEMEQIALQVPGVVQVESWAFGSGTYRRNDRSPRQPFSIVAPPTGTDLLRPILVEGRWLLPEDENALVINTEVAKRDPTIRVGERIMVKIGDHETSWRVVGKVRGVMTGAIAYANYPYYSALVNQTGKASGIRVVTEQHDPEFQGQVANQLRQRLTAAGLQISYIDTTGNVRQQVQFQFDIIVLFLTAMALLLASVGGLGLAGTMSINVLERTREIGVMRAIGASNGAVLRIFMVEGVLITLMSVLFGTLLAWPLSQALSEAVGQAFLQASLSYTFSLTGVLLWTVAASLIALAASFLPSWRAARLTVRDVLVYE